MEKVYELYIKATPERVWEAITDPKLRSLYQFGAQLNSDWTPGSHFELRTDTGGALLSEGQNLQVDPPRLLVQRLVSTWNEEVVREGATRITWRIEPLGDSSHLTLTHDELRDSANEQLYGGWPMILSGLKTFLETGEVLTTPGSLMYAHPGPVDRALLQRAAGLAIEYLAGLPDRPVGRPIDPGLLRESLGGPLPDGGEAPIAVIERLARDADPGLVASAGPRYFGFVIGGSLPVTVATEWLGGAWDQNAGTYPMSPAAAVVEEIAGDWLRDLFGLPVEASVGFVTGATMASFTALAAARHAVLLRQGFDVEVMGLFGAPPISVIVGAEAHATIFLALRMLGLGSERVIRVAADGQGRMRADELRRVMGGITGPTIVCAQAGNVNTGAFDPLREITAATNESGAWLHVDGAFGLWAAASPSLHGQLEGVERAQSWSTDAHKWLNVPYDCGLVFVADRDAHRSAMGLTAAYLSRNVADTLNRYDYVPEASRRAHGLAVYTALRTLGRSGVTDLVDRCCGLARRMAARLSAAPGFTVLNEVNLNQVLVRFAAPGDDGPAADARTNALIDAVQRDGTCWLGGTTWQGLGAMRISVSNWSTTEDDIDRSADAILRCAASEQVARDPR